MTREAAQAVLEMVLTDTMRANELATAMLAEPELAGEARMLALFALGRSHVELGEPQSALPSLEEARGLAESLGDDEMNSLVSSRLAVALFESGRGEEALTAVNSASQIGSAIARGTALNAKAMILGHQGQLLAAKESFDLAVDLLDSIGDENMVVRALASRSAVEARLGQLDAAESDLERSTELARSLGLGAIVAGNLHNLGYVRSRAGMIPEALEAYGQAREAYESAGAPARAMAILDTDNAETLLLAGLNDEALDAALRTLEEATASGNVIQQAESHLLVARILFAGERMEECVDAADTAARLFDQSERRPWAGQARSLGIQAEDTESRDIGETRSIIDELEAQGWVREAQNLLTLLSRSLLERGELEQARVALDRADRGRGAPAILRSSIWHSRALLRVAEGDRTGALRALRSGLNLLDDHRAALGATELRVSAARRAAKICALGVGLSLESGRRADALRWIERGRAQALRLPPTRPPRDENLAHDLAELRRLEAEARDTDLNAERLAELEAEIAGAERRIREHARVARGGRQTHSVDLVVADLRAELDDRTLVEFFELDDRLRAAIVDRTGVRIVELGEVGAVESTLDSLMFGLRRFAAGRVAPSAIEAVRAGLDASASELDDMLRGALPAAGDVAIVPSGSLQATPWQLLPSLSGRAVTTAPSAHVWMRARSPAERGQGVQVLAGPGLPAAVDEARSVHAMYEGAELLVGKAATVEAGLSAAADAAILHLAAHGTFRADSPMFSSLQLSDGPLTIYDIERLRSVPDTVVLSACHAAAGEASVGDEVIGTAMALVGMGVRSVVAPLVAIADEATARVMVEFHRHLSGGDTPERALAAVASGTAAEDPMLAATAAAFIVIGSDSRD